MKITGNHAIIHAVKNKNRKNKTFYGSVENFNKLQLNCPFKESQDEFLLVNEAFVEFSIQDFINHDKIILLDGLMDPRNVGAIIRTAAALGFYVIIRKNKGCPINSTVIHCAAGGVDETKILELSNINNNLQLLKNNGFWCFGLHETGTIELQNYKIDKTKILLVIGSESDGISNIVQNELDYVIKIKTGSFSTLNASVAASVAMFHFS